MNERDFIKSLAKATRILDAIRINEGSISLEKISRSIQLNKTTCFRFLQTMLELNILVQDSGSKNYKLGPKLISLGLSALDGFDLHREALPLMRELRDDTRETVNLSILDGCEIVIIERFRSNHLYSANLTVGSKLPLHCTSQGKAILAFSKPEKLEELMSCMKFKPYTAKTVKNKNDLKRQLLEIRKTGYSINIEEFEIGIAAVAGPIINHAGEAVASLNVSFPLARHPDKAYIGQISERVLQVCRKLSFYHGYSNG